MLNATDEGAACGFGAGIRNPAVYYLFEESVDIDAGLESINCRGLCNLWG